MALFAKFEQLARAGQRGIAGRAGASGAPFHPLGCGRAPQGAGRGGRGSFGKRTLTFSPWPCGGDNPGQLPRSDGPPRSTQLVREVARRIWPQGEGKSFAGTCRPARGGTGQFASPSGAHPSCYRNPKLPAGHVNASRGALPSLPQTRPRRLLASAPPVAPSPPQAATWSCWPPPGPRSGERQSART